MKKYFIGLLLCLLSVGCMKKEGEKMVIIHATDLHFISDEITDDGQYFMEMLAQGDGKVSHYSVEIVDAFIYEMLQLKPDVIILSGDISFNGAIASHVDLANRLKVLQEEGIQVILNTGNHDVDYSMAAKFHDDSFARIESPSNEEFFLIYHEFGFSDASSHDEYSLSYMIDISDDVALLMLDTNIYQGVDEVEKTYEWVEAQLQIAEDKGQTVIGVTHKNVIAHHELLEYGSTLSMNDKLLDIYQRNGVKLNLTGHIHAQHISSNDDFYEIVTGALCSSPHIYAVLELSDDQIIYTTKSVDVEAWAKHVGSKDENLLNFSEYSENYFKTIATNKFIQSGLSPDVAVWISDVNHNYFSGRLDKIELSGEHYLEAIESNDFVSYYLKGMFNNTIEDHTTLTLDR